MILNPFSIIKYQLYLLQLENYELGRYFNLLILKGLWPKGEQRKSLVWTAKAKALMLMAVSLHLLIVISLAYWSLVLAILVAIILFTIYFLLFTVALLLLWPFDFIAKQFIIRQAKFKIQNLGSQIKVIGVAGSYGKTTMKEMLGQVLGVGFQVLATPESINTPVGIARWILNKVNAETEILIVEMGEHYAGDIKELCNLTKPDIAVVTGINQAHLQRFKTMENLEATVFEIVSEAKPGATVVLNGDDKRVMESYKKYIWPDHKPEIFSKNSANSKFNTEKLGWEMELEGVGKIEVALLGEYAIGNIVAAIKIATVLGMSAEDIKKGIAKIHPVEHRLEPIKSAGNVLVIDDSYNGNPAGVTEAIKVLSEFTNRRKIYITPGLVEMGRSEKEVHIEIGKQLAVAADVVILIKNSVTPNIELGIRNYGLGIKKPEVVWFNTALEAHAGLKNILKPGDVILFQNDWGDNYV